MPRLFLVPNTINESALNLLPAYVGEQIQAIRVFFVEEPKSARRLLKSLHPDFPFSEARFLDLNEHTTAPEIKGYLKVIQENDAAVISEAGCPCVADPGGELVLLAHQNNFEIIPLVGPSSIILALMASGLNGQNFAFNGYLPKDKQERLQKIKNLEQRSSKEKQTQIFMETPYRNQSLFEDTLAACHEKTFLCIASHITAADQQIKTMSIGQWKKTKLNFDKKPTLFLLYHA